ncbi:MAG: DUF262 domain-containing protein [Saprospiraceae bacterium]
MEVKFTPEHKVINDLFAREIKYIIPEYQRPYSWGCEGKSDKNNQVNSMWNDLYTYFLDGKRETYFFGSMVLIGNGNRIYQVVDGQQRLTTMVLLFAAIKCFVQQTKQKLTDDNLSRFTDKVVSLIDELTFNEKLFGAKTVEKKVKIEKSNGFDYDSVFSSTIDCGAFREADYKSAKREQLEVAGRYFKNKDYFVEKLQENFLTDGHFTEENAEQLNNFLDFIKNRVSVVRIMTDSFDIAYHIFEILNNRGLPLSNKDLFRNFIIQKFDALKNEGGKYASIDPTEKWTALEENFDLRDDFLARWVESVKVGQQQYSAFNDLKDIYEKKYSDQPSMRKIEILYADIERDLGYFTTIVNADVENPFLRSKINVLLNAGNNRYTLNFLLALWRQFEGKEDAVFDLVNAYEIFLLNKVLVGRFVSGPVYGAISNLREIDGTSKAVAVLAPNSIKESLKKAIEEGSLDNDAGKLLISKWIWIQEAMNDDDLIDQKLLFEKASLEHIIPQSPENGTNWKTDFDQVFVSQYTYRLGNMTLLTKDKNSAARNFDFSKKKIIYHKTMLPITQELANLPKIDAHYIENRHNRLVKGILKDLGLTE